jgi:hypothetical protein
VFACLAATEMVAAIGACRSWHSAGERRTAWPSFDVARFISELMRNPGYKPKCVGVKLNCLRDIDAALAGLTQIVGSRVLSQTHELRVSSFPGTQPRRTAHLSSSLNCRDYSRYS